MRQRSRMSNIELQIGIFESTISWGDVVPQPHDKADAEEAMVTEQSEPTLWPQSGKGEIRMKLALESLEKENKSLKELVVRLSETILRNVVEAKPVKLSKNTVDH
jgi:hypothetical protein